MPDLTRVYDGFTVLDGGMDGGKAASLLRQNQCALAVNVTFRDSYARSREPVANLPLTGSPSTWSGKFQGAMFYDAEQGNSGFIVSRAGRLFRIQLGKTNTVTEITPMLPIVTTADFNHPAINDTVYIDVNEEGAFTMGETLVIDSGSYLIQGIFTQQILAQYLGGAANVTISAGNAVADSVTGQLIFTETNPATFDFVHLFQAENYAIILAGQHKPVIYDGASARLAHVDEVPPGVMGTYAWGRIWVVLPDQRTFRGGDIVFGPSGTPQLGYRDAILKFTENTFLNEGGDFQVRVFGSPYNAGPITSILPIATQDTSLGIGALVVGTSNMVFGINAPVDRTTWKNLNYPIQTVALIDYGPSGPRSIVPVNSDLWYRSTDGIRSFIVARRNFGSWGNTPISNELSPVLDNDTDKLLFYGSSILFNNRFYTTVAPRRTATGIAHSGLAVCNFDLLSDLGTKNPPAWEGFAGGLDVLQLVKGHIDGVERAFAFALNGTDVELWEIMPSGYYDQFTEISGGNTSITRTAVQSALETRSMSFGNGFQLKGLYMADLFLDEIFDTVTLTIKFKPDQYPAWINWTTLTVCANVSQCTVQAPGQFTCQVWQMNQKQYAARIRIPQPPEDCNSIALTPVRDGYEFQFRLEWTGHCRVRQFRPHAKLRSMESEGICPSEPTCIAFAACDTPIFGYDSHGT